MVALFTQAHFLGRASFLNCQFGRVDTRAFDPVELGVANFSDCVFERPTNFRNACFITQYPMFYGTLLHDKTTFTAKESHWPDEAHLKVKSETTGQTLAEKLLRENQKFLAAKEACATIRHALAKQGLPEEEHFFFRREMHFAGKVGSIWQRLPYLLFGMFSDYGHSIARPTLWLAGLWAFGFVAFWGYLAGCCVPAPSGVIENPMGSAMALSFSNLFPLFGFGRTFLKEELEALPAVLQLLSGVQTVFSLPLLFFLGLGLRQRFRLR
ncbi:pentapeptide repeat-containing protein [Pseudophaeobacter sp.]|uniref:pentapeptide repeat-containing protein n=1 Tax=Pseudophaeobacter sp. TaxID=1971739 RepID=UPI004058DF38